MAILFWTTGLCRAANPTPVARVVIGFYDSKTEGEWGQTAFHERLEMPFNHLGLIVEPHDINDPWPDLSRRDDVRGIMLWLHGETIDDPAEFIRWTLASMRPGRHLGIIGISTFGVNSKGQETPLDLINQMLALTGVQLLSEQVNVTYKWAVNTFDPAYFGFERPFPKVLPSFGRANVTADGKSLLSLTQSQVQQTSDLATLGPQGGYVADDDYAITAIYEIDRVQWELNPFSFLASVFATDDMPKPDYTTLDGNRVYFSHIDGDGWRNASQIPTPDGKSQRAVDVLYNSVFKAYPNLPFTVAPVAADLDPNWCGDDDSRRVARQILALPNIELSSHTYSHPLSWKFFADYTPAKEKPLLADYPPCIEIPDNRGAIGKELDKLLGRPVRNEREGGSEGDSDNPSGTPRSYAQHEYVLSNEIEGAREYLSSYAPGKKLTLLQWSGDTTPYPEALAATTKAGLLNLNGGDTRFDDEFKSNVWVAPLGRWTPAGWQIYAAASNENTYTDHWTDRFYGLRYLHQTYENTESPRRLNPINLYFHIFVADRAAGLAGLREALDWISKQAITPVTTSDYARIANGFYAAKLLQTGPASWQVVDRGGLQTIRFDGHEGVDVDYSASTGVLGSSRAENGLYVALDPDVASPIISLTPSPRDPAFTLAASRWPIHGLIPAQGGISFHTAGYGHDDMTWRVTAPGPYEISIAEGGAIDIMPAVTAVDGLLHVTLPRADAADVTITIRKSA